MKTRLFLLLFLASFAACGAAYSADPSRKEAVSDLAKVEKEMEKQKAKASTLAEKSKAASDELKNLQTKLVVATEALREKQDALDDLEDKLQALEAETDKREDQRAATEDRFRDLTSLFVRLTRWPPALYVLRVEPEADQFHRGILLRALLDPLRKESEGLEQSLEKLDASHRKLDEERKLVAAARQNQVWQRNNLDKLVRTRQGLLQKTEAEKASLDSQLASLADEAKDLRQLIDRLTRKSTYVGGGLAAGLKMPTGGKIIRGFGVRDADGVASQGVTISGSPDAPIVAPADGRVVFAGPFRGYGKIVIIDHGGGRHSFLSGFGAIDADVEQQVNAGEPLGALPAGKGGARPELYFEERLKGEPVNPAGK